MIAFNVALRPHVLCNDVLRRFRDLSIWKLYFIGSRVEDGVVVCQSSKFSIGISLQSLDLGKEVDLRLYTDSSYADDKLTRRSRTGYFVFMKMALIDWMSKKQATVETSTFSAEFVALKHGIKRVRGLCYKLRMMGVQISGPTDVYGDNMSVIKNTQNPESTLKKKSNSICYHASRESVAMDESRMAHISTNENPADITSKIVGGGHKRTYLVGKLKHDIEDDRDEHLESVS